MNILGIETSCDETAAAVVRDGRTILSNVINSQIKLHEKYGGVVPEIASKAHTDAIDAIVKKAVLESGLGFDEIDAVAVTSGPGLAGSLLVGVSYANALAWSLDVPLIATNHLQAHSWAASMSDEKATYPYVLLLVSGGHTIFAEAKSPTDIRPLGTTIDDAAGEAFDKISKYMGFGYPGGPIIDKMAKQGNPKAIRFPKGKDLGMDVSFSGLKTSVMYYTRGIGKLRTRTGEITEEEKLDIAASFQETVVNILWDRVKKALNTTGLKRVCLSGGVACNSRIRLKFAQRCEKMGVDCHFPPPVMCTDNAAMVAGMAFHLQQSATRDYDLNASPNLGIESCPR